MVTERIYTEDIIASLQGQAHQWKYQQDLSTVDFVTIRDIVRLVRDYLERHAYTNQATDLAYLAEVLASCANLCAASAQRAEAIQHERQHGMGRA